jgi:hypothetical protein
LLSTAWHRFLGVDGMGLVEGRVGWSGQGARKRALEESLSGLGATLPQEKEVRVEDLRRDGISKAL